MSEENNIYDLIDRSDVKRLIDLLTKFVLGDIKLTEKQAEALMLLVDKYIPDLEPQTLEEALEQE